MRRILVLVSLVFLGFLQACEEENPETTILVTEEVLLTSGEQARLLGRLITTQAINPIDHGFYLSLDANFSSPIIISLGPKEGPGRFIGEVSGLNIGQTYFARAFMDLGNGPEFGNTIELTTLTPGLDSFEPNFGREGSEVFILGRNFTEDTRVFFGDQEAQVLENLFESRLTVRVPAVGTSATVPVRVVVQDEEIIFPTNYEYQTGTFELLGKFPESGRLYDNVFWENDGKLYVGLGSVNRSFLYDKIYSYTPTGNVWNEVPFPGTNRSFGFATENYLSGGISSIGQVPFIMNRSFWRFDGTNFTQLGNIPFDSRVSLAFEIGNQLYVMGGKEGNPQSVRRYNPSTATWLDLADAPAEMSAELAHFTYQNKQYFVFADGSLVVYDPVMETWTPVSAYPGDLGQGFGFAEVIGDKAYVGAYRRTLEMWELDLPSLTWKKKNDIAGISQNITVGHAVLDGQIYILRVSELSISGFNSMDLYRFDPDGI